MLDLCKLPELTDTETPVKGYKDILKCIVCDNTTEAHYFGVCTDCPGMDILKEKFEESFELNSVENVILKQWIQAERITVLETITKPTEEFSFFRGKPAVIMPEPSKTDSERK